MLSRVLAAKPSLSMVVILLFVIVAPATSVVGVGASCSSACASGIRLLGAIVVVVLNNFVYKETFVRACLERPTAKRLLSCFASDAWLIKTFAKMMISPRPIRTHSSANLSMSFCQGSRASLVAG